MGYAPNGRKTVPPPAIHLKGHWLKDAGLRQVSPSPSKF
ncbi:MAG: SymE family type I addiction module toxin [Pseudomonadota bacterium]